MKFKKWLYKKTRFLFEKPQNRDLEFIIFDKNHNAELDAASFFRSKRGRKLLKTISKRKM